MYYCYILYSTRLDRYYTGSTSDLALRLAQHNSGKRSHYTSAAADWEIVYSEAYETRGLAQRREMEIKRKKSRKYIDWLVSSQK